MSLQSFDELGVSPAVVEALAAREMHHPFRIQELVLPSALAGDDVLAKAPTGSGKTLAFALPIVERIQADGNSPAALVLVPTRELALQVAAELAAWRPHAASALRPSTAARRSRRRRRRRGTPTSSSPRPVACRILSTAGSLPRAREHPRSRRSRPDARHGLQAAGRAHRSRGSRGSGRRCSSPRRSTARSPSSRARSRGTRRGSSTRPRTRLHTSTSTTSSSPSRPTARSIALIEELEAERGLAVVFVRTKRGRGPARAEARPGGMFLPWRCTETWRRARGSGRSSGFAPAGEDARRNRRRGARSRPRRHHARHQLRPAATTTRATSTASAAPDVPVAAAAESRSCSPSSRAT